MPVRTDICVVIPCYNEGTYFHGEEYTAFLSKAENVVLCFVNDGSKDNTLEVLTDLKKRFPGKVDLVSYTQNQGKAHAVREGVQHCLSAYEFDFIAYLDADLSVSLEECVAMKDLFTGELVFCFGSRIARVGSVIQRRKKRFLIGRFIATLISELLSLKVYDTQCGCKMFRHDVAGKLFAEPFLSTWLFDVEIFCRMIALYSRDRLLDTMLEYPLKSWIDQGDSKVKLSYFFKMWMELYQIRKAYRKVLSRS